MTTPHEAHALDSASVLKNPTAIDQGLALLSRRMHSLPEALAEAATLPLVQLPNAPNDGWTITGIGGSEGPARCLAGWLQELGFCARFVPCSSFAEQPPSSSQLVVCSQGLSPNARLALSKHASFEHTSLLTALPKTAQEKLGITAEILAQEHPPAGGEEGLLLRVVGPCIATLFALRWCEALSTQSPRAARWKTLSFDRLSSCTQRALEDSCDFPEEALCALASGSAAILTIGAYEGAHALRWKWLEGLGHDVPVWDVLQFSHGPFQACMQRPRTLFVLETRAEPSHEPLLDRFERVIAHTSCRVLRLRATQPAPLHWFEHDALCNGLLERTLAKFPRDLHSWPGKGLDGPLYDLGR